MDSSSFSNATLDLPNELMLILFDHLPLTVLVHLNEVSRQWSQLRSATLLQQKELIIAKNAADLIRIETPDIYSFLISLVKNDDGSPFLKQRKDRLDRHALYSSWMQPEMVDSIMRLMPNLTVIRIRQEGDFAQPWKIKHLLHHYRHQLIEVSIDYTGIFHGVQADWRSVRKVFASMFSSLIATLNDMTVLTSLALYLLMPRGMETSIRVDLSVASRLKTLKVYAQGFESWMVDCDVLCHTCNTYAEENCHFQALGGMPKFHLNTLLSFGPQVSAALREVGIYTWCDADEADGLRQFARQFHNLQVLWTKIRMSMAQFATLMAPCKALAYLKVFLSFDRTLNYPVALANRLPVDQLQVLPTVKVLDLICFTASHEDYEKMNLDVIFPNVQVIKLTHKLNHCQVCHFTVPENIAESADWVQSAYSLVIHKCQRLFRAQFAKFSKLTTVEADIGLQKISSSYKERVSFTRKTLGKMTYDLERGFIHLSLPKQRFHFSNEVNGMRFVVHVQF